MNFKPTNFTELQLLIAEYTKGKYSSNEDVYWFLAYQEARNFLLNATTKDLAYVFVEGYPALNTIERVNQLIETWFEDQFDDVGNLITFWFVDVEDMLVSFYGKEEKEV